MQSIELFMDQLNFVKNIELLISLLLGKVSTLSIMKKLLEKDKKTRKKIKRFEKKKFILKIIFGNFYFTNLTRLKALNKINLGSNRDSKTFLSNRCVLTINKKKTNKLTRFSRIIFRQLAKARKISGIYKMSR